ncbi:MAG: 4Fe-4S dicluster domain-containing protein [bacterium]
MSDELIRTSRLDSNFIFEVSSHKYAKNINSCFACGTCTGGCPIHRVYPEYNPRKIIRMIKLGMRSEVLSSKYIWYCATCHTCEERCPRGVGFFNVLNVLKNIAAKEGFAPSPWIEQTKQITLSGISIPTQETWIKKREELSLRPLRKKLSEKAAKLIDSMVLIKSFGGEDEEICSIFRL